MCVLRKITSLKQAGGKGAFIFCIKGMQGYNLITRTKKNPLYHWNREQEMYFLQLNYLVSY